MKSEEFASAIEQYLKSRGFEALCPKAVLFDMDGVCYDSMPNHVVAWHESMAHYGLVMTAADAYATEGARGIDTVRALYKRQKGVEISLEQAQAMYDLKSKIFHDMPASPIMPGVMELMEQIQSCGLTIGIVTGSGQRPLIARLLSDFGRFLTEDHIVTAYDVDRGKPAPDPYLAGLKQVGRPAARKAVGRQGCQHHLREYARAEPTLERRLYALVLHVVVDEVHVVVLSYAQTAIGVNGHLQGHEEVVDSIGHCHHH